MASLELTQILFIVYCFSESLCIFSLLEFLGAKEISWQIIMFIVQQFLFWFLCTDFRKKKGGSFLWVAKLTVKVCIFSHPLLEVVRSILSFHLQMLHLFLCRCAAHYAQAIFRDAKSFFDSRKERQKQKTPTMNPFCINLCYCECSTKKFGYAQGLWFLYFWTNSNVKWPDNARC